MTKTWQVQDAKARFSEFLEASLKQGPQVVTRRGVEAAVLVPIEQWRRLEKMTQPNLKDGRYRVRRSASAAGESRSLRSLRR